MTGSDIDDASGEDVIEDPIESTEPPRQDSGSFAKEVRPAFCSVSA